MTLALHVFDINIACGLGQRYTLHSLGGVNWDGVDLDLRFMFNSRGSWVRTLICGHLSCHCIKLRSCCQWLYLFASLLQEEVLTHMQVFILTFLWLMLGCLGLHLNRFIHVLLSLGGYDKIPRPPINTTISKFPSVWSYSLQTIVIYPRKPWFILEGRDIAWEHGSQLFIKFSTTNLTNRINLSHLIDLSKVSVGGWIINYYRIISSCKGYMKVLYVGALEWIGQSTWKVLWLVLHCRDALEVVIIVEMSEWIILWRLLDRWQGESFLMRLLSFDECLYISMDRPLLLRLGKVMRV